ncbi:MAG: hypothetical protein Q9M97_06950 [Candidatus Gracilibacteria bacterium]|nr:hypothetical protein [Candidatus Gracilibacteria bacterium]
MQKTIYKNIIFLKIDLYYDFIEENKKFKNLIIGRVSSYFYFFYISYIYNEDLNKIYGKCSKKTVRKKYLGFSILEEFGIK